MKKFIFLALAVIIFKAANAQWTSPGNGSNYTFDDLYNVSNGAVEKINDSSY